MRFLSDSRDHLGWPPLVQQDDGQIMTLTLSVVRDYLAAPSGRCLCGVTEGGQHGWYTRAPSSVAATPPQRRRRRPVVTDTVTDTATDPSARGKPLLFNQLSRFCVRVAATSSALLSTDSRGEYAAHFSPGGSSSQSRSFFFSYTPPHRTRRHRRRACRKYNTNNNNIYYTLYYNILCTHVTRYRFPVMIILLQ